MRYCQSKSSTVMSPRDELYETPALLMRMSTFKSPGVAFTSSSTT